MSDKKMSRDVGDEPSEEGKLEPEDEQPVPDDLEDQDLPPDAEDA